MRTQPYAKRPVPNTPAAIPAYLVTELANIQRAIPVLTRVIVYGSAAPTDGTWLQGDQVLDETPSAGGFVGWVCTASGTPGTWKTFGAISP